MGATGDDKDTKKGKAINGKTVSAILKLVQTVPQQKMNFAAVVAIVVAIICLPGWTIFLLPLLGLFLVLFAWQTWENWHKKWKEWRYKRKPLRAFRKLDKSLQERLIEVGRAIGSRRIDHSILAELEYQHEDMLGVRDVNILQSHRIVTSGGRHFDIDKLVFNRYILPELNG